MPAGMEEIGVVQLGLDKSTNRGGATPGPISKRARLALLHAFVIKSHGNHQMSTSSDGCNLCGGDLPLLMPSSVSMIFSVYFVSVLF